MEREMIRDFRSHAAEFLDARERNDIDWLFIAQHHGVPTRLLDWTENPLVALYFACQSYDGEADGCVYALNAWELNKTTITLRSVPSTDGNAFKRYVLDLSSEAIPREVEADYPMALRPYHRFRRSNAQAGCFTIHGNKVQALDKIRFVRRNRQACVAMVRIDGRKKFNMLKELYALGIHFSALFQSIDSISETIKFRYGRDYFR